MLIKNRIFYLYIGKDVVRHMPLNIWFLIGPRPALMREDENGRMLLAAFGFEFIWGGHFYLWNDVREITLRMAGKA